MHLVEKFLKDIGKSGLESHRRLLKCPRKKLGDLFNRNSTGEFTRFCPTHPIAHGKGKIALLHGCFAVFSQMEYFPRVKTQPQKRVLVVLPNPARVRASRPY